MENVFCGVRHVPSAENSPSDQASAPPVSEPQPQDSAPTAQSEAGATVNAASTESPSGATQSASLTQVTEPKS